MTTSGTTTWRVLTAPETPDDLDHPDAWAVHAYSAIEHDVTADVWGWTDMWAPAFVMHGFVRHQTHATKTFLAAVPADAVGPVAVDDVAGLVLVIVPRDPDEGMVWVGPRVRRDGARAEVLDLLLDAAERHVRDQGREVLAFTAPFSPEPPAGPGALEPPTGAGRVPADDVEVVAAQARGYALEQVARHSTLHLPVPSSRLDALDASARRAAGDAYRTLTWRDEVPEDRLDDLAVLWSRMSTDAPSAGLDQDAESWDADRVRDHLAGLVDRSQHVLVTVAEEVASGALVAFTVIQVPYGEVPFGFQEDTLVLTEHRGHRLGTLVKVENLRALAAWRPGVARLHTWNAQENAHMLAINVALGFAGDGVAAVWQKRLG